MSTRMSTRSSKTSSSTSIIRVLSVSAPGHSPKKGSVMSVSISSCGLSSTFLSTSSASASSLSVPLDLYSHNDDASATVTVSFDVVPADGKRSAVVVTQSFVVSHVAAAGQYDFTHGGVAVSIEVLASSSSSSSSSSSLSPSPSPPWNKSLLFAYFTVASLWLFSQIVDIPYTVNLTLTTLSLIYVGAHHSLQLRSSGAISVDPSTGQVLSSDVGSSEYLTTSDALKFPFVGSAALFSLFLAFKYLNKDTVNRVILCYFAFAGVLALTTICAPIAGYAFPSLAKSRYTKPLLFVPPKFLSRVFSSSPPPPPPAAGVVLPPPAVAKWDWSIDLSHAEVLCLLLSIVFMCFYASTRHWALNNVLGIAFSVSGMSSVSLGQYKVGVILLVGLFFYDIFWVFNSFMGESVMVGVAKNLDGPIKLLFPKSLVRDAITNKMQLGLLGLGDVVIPGFFISLLLRFDAENANLPTFPPNAHAAFPRPYFHSGLLGYLVGIVTTLVVMFKFNHAQPALLYLVPACLGASAICAIWRGEHSKLWDYDETPVVVDDNKQEEQESGGGDKKKKLN